MLMGTVVRLLQTHVRPICMSSPRVRHIKLQSQTRLPRGGCGLLNPRTASLHRCDMLRSSWKTHHFYLHSVRLNCSNLCRHLNIHFGGKSILLDTFLTHQKRFAMATDLIYNPKASVFESKNNFSYRVYL